MGLIGRYIRTKLEDTPAFRALAAGGPGRQGTRLGHVPEPLAGSCCIATGAVLLNAVGFYVILSYMPTYLSEELGFGADRVLPGHHHRAGHLHRLHLPHRHASDRFGRKKVLITASVLFMLLTVPAFMLLDTGNFLVIVLVQILLGGMLTLNDGTLPSFLAEIFPTRVRYSGFAVSFNLSNALFGGTAPFMATLLIGLTANNLAPGLVPRGRRPRFPDRRRCSPAETVQEAAAAALTPHSHLTQEQRNTRNAPLTDEPSPVTTTLSTTSPSSSASRSCNNGEKVSPDLLRRRVRAPPRRACAASWPRRTSTPSS